MEAWKSVAPAMEIENTTQHTLHLPEEIIEFPKKSSKKKKKKSSKKYSKTEAGKPVSPPREIKNTTRRRHTPHLPQEIIEEILSKLKVKSLLRFRCVSKSWHCLIGSDRFIKSQLEKSRRNRNCYNLILNCNSENPVPGLKRCSMISFEDDPSAEPSPIDDPTNNHLMTDTRVLGHCDGLLCIVKQPGCLFVWNPSTRISVELPKLDLQIGKHGFGVDEQSGAYKMFVVLPKDNEGEGEGEWIGKLYSSKTNSWKTVEHGSLDLHHQGGEFVSGRIHWPVRSGYIETFDMKSEVFGVIELPCKPEVGVVMWLQTSLDSEEDILMVVCESANRTCGAWEMKKYGVKESWEKVCSVPIRSENESTYMVRLIEQGVVEASPRENIVGCDEAHCYIESLVSPISHKYR